jgi:hypothetical protein
MNILAPYRKGHAALGRLICTKYVAIAATIPSERWPKTTNYALFDAKSESFHRRTANFDPDLPSPVQYPRIS